MTAYRHPHDLIREWTERQEAVRRAYHGDAEPALAPVGVVPPGACLCGAPRAKGKSRCNPCIYRARKEKK